MSDPYDDFAANPASTLARLNPPTMDDATNCPQTTDAVDDFLRSGVATPVVRGFWDSFNINANWNRRGRRPARRMSPAQIAAQLLRLGHGHHYVIRGNRFANARDAHGNPLHRTTDGRLVTTTHYFVLANIRGRLWIIDAYRRTWNTDLNSYIQQQHFISIDYASEYETSPVANY
jgi:hypothetical protein